jgi:hypothetical protein
MTQTDYSGYGDEELVEEHEQALRIQRSELCAGNHQAARDVAEVRMAIWEEAQSRGIDL